ncbi:hypothetical protein TYRP_023443 [Tyrophagus putrescentiae]|nr:hypothetical protein TYRP_023443 [Tyrophagus putrescentiae]
MFMKLHSPQQCFPTGSSSHNGTSTKEPTERGFEIHIRDVEEYCGDCTLPTPYCGYGPCNIFGCNCDGGCRHK